MSEEERTVTVILTIPRNHFEYLWCKSEAGEMAFGKGRHERVRREVVRDEIAKLIKSHYENKEFPDV